MKDASKKTQRARSSARAAGLRYVEESDEGIQRIPRGRRFVYRDGRGRAIRNPKTLDRIKQLVIPPAWTDVWICPWPDGHIQATGRDARGRKQYRYHARWSEHRNGDKFDRMLEFGRALPALRRRVNADLRGSKLSRRRVLAAVVRLMETTAARVGNDQYARENNSYGLTTLLPKHASTRGGRIILRFRAKSGQQQTLEVCDTTLCRVIHQCLRTRGPELFKYRDEDGAIRDVTSDDVNAYIRAVMGGDFTAKDFRTWAGSCAAMTALERLQAGVRRSRSRRTICWVVEKVARHLSNRPATCRKYYIHPVLFEAYENGQLRACRRPETRSANGGGLTPGETRLLKLLKHQGGTRRGAVSRRKSA